MIELFCGSLNATSRKMTSFSTVIREYRHSFSALTLPRATYDVAVLPQQGSVSRTKPKQWRVKNLSGLLTLQNSTLTLALSLVICWRKEAWELYM
ncbi:hypothetical protein IGI04_028117 [Brassica rapa subsp. trilocularis]|uniref:Uncharacterized protein n=1 Tax=Brassica rapa subsp. trilocularis TaxID=1813537 RepID=A0ABQ7L3S0_BRACM|nr:hypothetical protein IGI04_028117 [Brassica rapa subsp. trilocularis]